MEGGDHKVSQQHTPVEDGKQRQENPQKPQVS